MPLALNKLATRLAQKTGRWNEAGKRPRENTIQYEDVIETFETNERTTTSIHPLNKEATVTTMRRLSKLGVTQIASQSKCPELRQRELLQAIAARVSLLQDPIIRDEDIAQIPTIDDVADSRQLAFIGARAPSISFVKYVERLVNNLNRWAHETNRPGEDSIGIQCGILAIEYLERAKSKKLTPQSIHRYFLAAFTAAIKFHFDYFISGSFWAGVCGLRLEELNYIETQFFSLLEWRLFVSPETYEDQLSKTTIF